MSKTLNLTCSRRCNYMAVIIAWVIVVAFLSQRLCSKITFGNIHMNYICMSCSWKVRFLSKMISFIFFLILFKFPARVTIACVFGVMKYRFRSDFIQMLLRKISVYMNFRNKLWSKLYSMTMKRQWKDMYCQSSTKKISQSYKYTIQLKGEPLSISTMKSQLWQWGLK